MSFYAVYTEAPTGGDRVYLDTLGILQALRWTTVVKGDWAATWQMILDRGYQHRALQPGRRVGIPISPGNTWTGTLKAPQRGTVWQFSAIGLAQQVYNYDAIAATSGNALAPNEIVDAAITRGLPATRPSSLPSLTAGLQASGSISVGAALDQVCQQLNRVWNIARNTGAITTAALPTTLTHVLQASDNAGGRTLDGYVTNVSVLYRDATTYLAATVQRENTAARIKYGRIEGQPLDLTPQGPMTLAQAQTAGDNYLAQNAPRPKFAGTFSVVRGQLLNPGGGVVDPATLQPYGALVRVLLTDPDTSAGETVTGPLQTAVGQVDYDADSSTLTLTPFDYSPQGLAALIAPTEDSAASSMANIPANIPMGLLAEAHLTVNSSQNITSGTPTAITGTVSVNNGTAAAGTLQVTVTVTAGRAYYVAANVELFSSVAADQVQTTILATAGTGGGTGVFFTPTWTLPTAGRADNRPVSAVFYATTSGTVTFTAQAARSTGTGNVNAAAGSHILVADFGV